MEETLICEPRRSLSLPLDDIVEVMRRLNARLSRSGSVLNLIRNDKRQRTGQMKMAVRRRSSTTILHRGPKAGEFRFILGPETAVHLSGVATEPFRESLVDRSRIQRKRACPTGFNEASRPGLTGAVESKGSSVCLELNKDQAFAVISRLPKA